MIPAAATLMHRHEERTTCAASQLLCVIKINTQQVQPNLLAAKSYCDILYTQSD
jgi:hypothetical protein